MAGDSGREEADDAGHLTFYFDREGQPMTASEVVISTVMTDVQRWVTAEQRMPRLSGEALKAALLGFELPLVEGWSWEMLAKAVVWTLDPALPVMADTSGRQSNVDVQAKLLKGADVAQRTSCELMAMASDPEMPLHLLAQVEEAQSLLPPQLLIGSGEMARFNAAVAELQWAASFMNEIAQRVKIRRGPWPESDKKKRRQLRAYYLAPVFEAAFDEQAFSNNYPGDKARKPTHFMVFFQRIMLVAYDNSENANLAENIKAALRAHRQKPSRLSDHFLGLLRWGEKSAEPG